LGPAIPDDDVVRVREREQLVAGEEVEDLARRRHAEAAKLGRRGAGEQREGAAWRRRAAERGGGGSARDPLRRPLRWTGSADPSTMAGGARSGVSVPALDPPTPDVAIPARPDLPHRSGRRPRPHADAPAAALLRGALRGLAARRDHPRRELLRLPARVG